LDTDIQFGEVEEARPERQLRPDKNRHYAVAAYGEPALEDLPIYVDLDVMHDMETHAQSDTSVELGGVLLGGQYEDENGRPFVIVTDSLRANHFEATKGSFKFTHDTWSEITREREQFPPELQMVGWYHTHPDWGVFLSGMDMFICDNFFNKKLDIALVIDPCRGDRGMFMWTGNPRQRVRRTGGFHLIASRYRQQELEQYVASLQGNEPMPANLTSGGYGAPVIHVNGDKQPPWMPGAVLGMLTLQFCLLALIAWKLIAPGAETSDKDRLLKELLAEKQTKARDEVQRQVLRDLAADVRADLPSDYVDSLHKREAELRSLREKLADRERDYANLRNNLVAAQNDLADQKEQADQDLIAHKKAREEFKATEEKHKTAMAALKKKIKELDPEAKVDDKEPGPGIADNTTWWIVGGTTAALALVAIGLVLWQKKPEEFDAVEEPPAHRKVGKPAAPAVDAVLETPAEQEEPRGTSSTGP
jgi:proteasome lid subunit RPN8/RPN11